MANVARVEATITAQNKLRPGLSSAARDLERFRNQQTKATQALSQASGQFRGMERMERAAGALRATVVGLGAGAVLQKLKESTVRFAEVDRAMSRTGMTGDATVEQTRRGTEELRNLAQQTGILFDPAQKGLDAITASGRDFADAMKMMPAVLKTAQASGAGVDDIANSSTALIDHMKISIQELGAAQDTLAMGGKLGKFELKDMARYLPSMLPAYKAIGKTGQEGLRNLVAMLQVIRSGTGTAEEAAASAQNIFSKMESEETVKNFGKMGVDLPKAMTKARKEGKDLIAVFLELSQQALKGDLSKIPQLFKDMEVQRGMRPLLADMAKILELQEKLKSSGGTINTDFARISADAKASIDRLKESADRATTALGSMVAEAAMPAISDAAKNLDSLAQAMERAAEAARKGGFTGATAQIGSDMATSISAGQTENAGNWQKIEDDKTLAGISSGLSDRAELEKLMKRDPRSLSRQEVARRHILQKQLGANSPLTQDQLNAVARDQLRRVGPAASPIDPNDPAFQTALESVREARRAGAFPQSEQTAPIRAKDRPLPPVRPASLGGAVPVQGLDDANSKAIEIKTNIDALGPAGQIAGSAMATGLASGLQSAEQQLAASVARMQQMLNSLKAPSLSFGTGAGGLPNGKSMGEVR